MELELISPTEIAKEKIQAVQDYTLLSSSAIANLFQRPLYLADIMQQADSIGVGSLPIVVLTGLSIGALLALNSANTLQRFGGITLIGQLVSIGMVTELGPLITGLMVAGRNASGMASELGSMVVTEQIDAMRALGTDPAKKLVTPRVVATHIHAVLSYYHRRPARPGWWKPGRVASVRTRHPPILDFRLADSRLPRCLHGFGEARALRLRDFHHWLLLRYVYDAVERRV